MKSRKSFSYIVLQVHKLLKGKELSIRRISIITKSQWRTAEKALILLKKLGLVRERKNKEVERTERLFSLKRYT